MVIMVLELPEEILDLGEKDGTQNNGNLTLGKRTAHRMVIMVIELPEDSLDPGEKGPHT